MTCLVLIPHFSIIYFEITLFSYERYRYKFLLKSYSFDYHRIPHLDYKSVIMSLTITIRLCTFHVLRREFQPSSTTLRNSVPVSKIEIIETFLSYSENLISIVGGGCRFIAGMLLHRQQYLVCRYRSFPPIFSLFYPFHPRLPWYPFHREIKFVN